MNFDTLMFLFTPILMIGGRLGGGRRRRKRAGKCGPCPAGTICPLSNLEVGQAACLVCTGANRRLRRRLAELGLTPGVEMEILQNCGGPILISVRDSRLAVGRDTARELSVNPLPDRESK
ncbi:MAG: FeoA family protein [Chloroflexota bacterium]